MTMAKNTKAVTDEQIIAALLQHGTVKAAAAAAGLSVRAVYDRMNDCHFRAAYTAAQTDIIRAAVYSINSKLSAAVDTIAQVMEDQNTSAATRLQAAGMILNNAAKFTERLAKSEAEQRAEDNLDNPLHDLYL